MTLQPETSPGFLLWHATLRWQRAIAACLAPWTITHVQFVLLACAWWMTSHGEPPNQLELARQAAVDPKMASEVIRALERKSLVRRTVDSADTRARRIEPTPKGIEVARETIEAVERADALFFGRLETPDADRIVEILTRLAGGVPQSL
jgi:DNA-binding MarR family transcriptional regulator